MIIATRDTEPHVTRPDGVKRIHQIGDSISYGAGVYPDQTLSAHLTEFLNRAYPNSIVEVKPYGLRSGNMWDSWSRFESFWREDDCDGVIFQICNNDAQFATQVPGNHKGQEALWTDDGPVSALVDRTFQRIADFCREHDIDLVMIFYSLMPADARIIESVAARCEKYGIPFADILSFLSEAGNTNEEQYRATEYDSHPSSFTHAQTARRLTTEIIRQNWLPGLKASESPADPGGDVLKAAGALVDGGMSENHVINWARAVLEAKAQAARRTGTRAEREAKQESIRQALQVLEADWQDWCSRQWRVATGRSITWRREEIYKRLNNMGGMMKSAAEIVTAWEVSPKVDMAEFRSMAPEAQNNPFRFGTESPGDTWQDAALDIDGTMKRLAGAVAAFDNAPGTSDRPASLMRRMQPPRPAISLSPETEWLSMLAPQIEQLYRRVEALGLDGRDMTELGVLGSWLWNFLMHIRNRTITVTGYMGESTAVTDQPLKPLTFVDVHVAVDGAALDKSVRNYLSLQANYDVPLKRETWFWSIGHMKLEQNFHHLNALQSPFEPR